MNLFIFSVKQTVLKTNSLNTDSFVVKKCHQKPVALANFLIAGANPHRKTVLFDIECSNFRVLKFVAKFYCSSVRTSDGTSLENKDFDLSSL